MQLGTLNSGRADREAAIGIFDSGVGGLTVLRAIRRHLPGEDIVYLGDTARLPYGTKSAESVIRYAVQAAEHLLEYNIKCLVVACNTASSVAMPALARTFAPLPAIGVVHAGAAAGVRASPSGRIGVLATESTVQKGAYQRAIRKVRTDAVVSAQACSLFVALAEEGWCNGTLVENIVAQYLKPLLSAPLAKRVDCLLLGCTHFPLLADAISRVVGKEIVLVDSAETTAESLMQLLGDNNLLRASDSPGTVKFLATDNPARFARIGSLFLGETICEADVQCVDL